MTKGATLDMRRVKSCGECGQRFGLDAMFCPFDGSTLKVAELVASVDPLVGQTVDGRYRVEGVLGEGGMGKVYRVQHVSLGREFALKALRPDLARERELAERFIQEARTTASVHHPNIVSITDFGQLPDETPFFVMELLHGRTLADLIDAGGPIPAGRAVRMIRQVAAALGAAHAAGIIHRDMKPENVFLLGGAVGAGATDDVRVVDFGAAKVLGASRLTKTGIVFGTPHYMSPEQASGAPVDHRADIYALGIIMYEMFTGRVPFEADTYMGVLTQHMFVNPVPPSQVNPAARELGALEEITLRCLEKRPEDRFATMEDVVRAIDGVVRFEVDGRVSVEPRLEEASPRHSRVPPRFRMADELEPPTLEEMRAASDSGLPPTPRSRAGLWIAAAVVVVVGGGAIFAATRGASAPVPVAATTSASAAPNAPELVPAPSDVATPTPTAATSATTATLAPDAGPPPTKVEKRPPAIAPPPRAPTVAPPRPAPKCDPDDPFCKR